MTETVPGIALADALAAYGFSPVKAELWAEFVTQAILVLQRAAEELRTPNRWAAFVAKRGALGAPRRRARHGVMERAPIEDALTSELGHLVRRIRSALPIGHFLRLNEVTFCPEHMVQSATRAGRHSRKVDFFIYAATAADAPELAIEAKPLLAESDIAGRYLAEDGIGCFFTTDSPYTTQPVAGMLAYTIRTDAGPWRTEIRAAVEAYQPPPLAVTDVALPALGEHAILSRHTRPALGLDPVAIVHLEMIFSPSVEAIAEIA